MYFWNVLPATTNFSQSISNFASLLRNLRLWVCWGAKVFAGLIKSSSQTEFARAVVFPKWLWVPHVQHRHSQGSWPDKPLFRIACLYLSAPLHTRSLWLRQEVGNSAVPAFTHSCSLDFNSHSFLQKKEQKALNCQIPSVPLHRVLWYQRNSFRNHLRKWLNPSVVSVCGMAFSSSTWTFLLMSASGVSVLVFSGCPNNVQKLGDLKQQIFVFSQFWM